MAWEPDDIDTIQRRIRADVRALMPGTEPGIWPGNLYVNTAVFAGIADAFYQRLAWMRDQRFVHKADPSGLSEFAAAYGISSEQPAFAAGNLSVVSTIGTIFSLGTRFIRPDGVVFVTNEDITTTQPLTSIGVHAEEAGSMGNTVADVGMTMETPIVGFASAAVDISGIGGGREVENESSLRAKLQDVQRNPRIQGSPSDYVRWAKQWPGVTRAWAFRATPSAGSVSVFFMMDESYPNGIPLAGDVDGVFAILDEKTNAKPGLIVQAPIAQPIATTLTSLSPNILRVQRSVVDEVKAMIKRQGKPGTFAKPFTFSRSWLDEAVSIAPDEDSHTISLPAADILFQAAAPGDAPFIPTYGGITFPP